MSSVNGLGELTECILVHSESMSDGRHSSICHGKDYFTSMATGKEMLALVPGDIHTCARSSDDDDTGGPCMRVETLTGSMAPCKLGQTASHWKKGSVSGPSTGKLA